MGLIPPIHSAAIKKMIDNYNELNGDKSNSEKKKNECFGCGSHNFKRKDGFLVCEYCDSVTS